MVPRGDGSTVLRLRRGASIQDFADKIGANSGQLITVLFHLGQMATATASLDEDTFQILGEELGYKIEIVSPEDEEREQQPELPVRRGNGLRHECTYARSSGELSPRSRRTWY